MEHNYAVIMAGGVGSRFWPTSTSRKPKQFLDILRTGAREIDTNSGPIVVSLVPYNAKGQSGEDEGKPKFTKKTKREK